MNANDLFSFLEEIPPENGDVELDMMETDPEFPKKRKTGTQGFRSRNGNTAGEVVENEPEPTIKKPRLASPKPVVVDEFEREAKREIAASAGLTGGIEPG